MPPARPTTMDDSYDRKRYAHLDNKTMDNSYSHLRAAGASANTNPPLRANAPQTPLRRNRHVDEGAVLAEMSTAAPPFPHKALDAAVVAHCGRDRLGSGAAWADHCAFRGVDISPVVRADEGAADEKHRYYARYSAGLQNSADFFNASSRAWCTAPREASIRPNTRAATVFASNSRPGPVDEPIGVVEPLHVNFKADLEWVVLSGKFKVEAGPVNPVPGHPKVADTLVAGSWWAVWQSNLQPDFNLPSLRRARAGAAAPVASQSRQLRQLGDFLGSGPRGAAPVLAIDAAPRAPRKRARPPTPEAVEPAGRDAGSDATFRSAPGKFADLSPPADDDARPTRRAPRRPWPPEASLDRERDAVVDLTDSPLDTQTEAAVAAAEASLDRERGAAGGARFARKRGRCSRRRAGAIAPEAVVVVDLGGGLCCLRVGGVEKHASARGRSEHFKVASGYGLVGGWEAFSGGPRRARAARPRRAAPAAAGAAAAARPRKRGYYDGKAPLAAPAAAAVAAWASRPGAVAGGGASSSTRRSRTGSGTTSARASRSSWNARARAGAGGGPPPIRGAILADGMGLGKAAMALSARRAGRRRIAARTDALGAAGALRLLCCHPALWDRGEAAGDALEPSIVEAAAARCCPPRAASPAREYGAGAKVAFLRAALPALAARGERVVVASGYVSALRLVARLLRDLGLSYCRVGGSASDGARAVGAFAAGAAEAAAGRGEPPPPAVLLLSSRAGAGLNLPGACVLILLEPDWNPAVDDQTCARVWRPGQGRRTRVLRLAAAGTLEETVLARQAEKQALWRAPRATAVDAPDARRAPRTRRANGGAPTPAGARRRGAPATPTTTARRRSPTAAARRRRTAGAAAARRPPTTPARCALRGSSTTTATTATATTSAVDDDPAVVAARAVVSRVLFRATTPAPGWEAGRRGARRGRPAAIKPKRRARRQRAGAAPRVPRWKRCRRRKKAAA
ncbi:DNA repair and recombination protein [Aureococcus anophagefferens]|uniref:DNA repair and recombination protein n=1 Tax=Aureococcus anophagefferens TaxID=44056 RepID=A0ABR1GD07_AURAN